MSKNISKLDKVNLSKVCEVLKRRLDSRAGKYFQFKFQACNGFLCIQGKANLKNDNSLTMPAHFYMYTMDKNWHMKDITMKWKDNVDIPAETAVKHLLSYAREHDVVIGIWSPIKLIKAGETLESLCIEHDLMT